MGLIGETADVFSFLRDVFDCFPVAVKLLIYGAFGGVIYLSVMKGLGR